MNFPFWANEENFYNWVGENNIDWSSPEIFVAINASLRIVRLDPEYAALNKSLKINFIGNFNFYQLLNSSAIRSAPLRILYDRKSHLLFYLDGTNDPIYRAWAIAIKKKKKGYIRKEDAVTYIKFFFDNVKGRHGRFEIVESFDHLKNRVNTFLILNPLKREVRKFQINDWKAALSGLFSKHTTSVTHDKEVIIIKSVLMTFQSSLFCTDVTIDINLDKDTYGNISLSNEHIGVLANSEQTGPYILFQNSNDENEGISSIPYFTS